MAPLNGRFRISTLNGANTRVSVTGELDLATAPQLLTLLEELVRSGHTTLLVDLADITFLDSSGLAVLLRTHQQLQRSSGRLAVLCPDARKRDLFELVGHHLLFPVEGTLTAAVARLPAGAPQRQEPVALRSGVLAWVDRRARGADNESVANGLGPTRPDRLTIWPVEGDQFGIDVRWGGAAGNRRATVVARLLSDAGIRGRLSQTLDGAWEVRVGPVPGQEVAQVIDRCVW